MTPLDSPLFIRSRPLIGDVGVAALASAHAAVFGVGGVGSYAIEALVRAGVGCISAVDSDVVAESNLNRQLIATYSSIGQAKVDAAAARAREISRDVDFSPVRLHITAESVKTLDFAEYSVVIDAVDDVAAKLAVIEAAAAAGVPVVSVMGAGNKLDPCAFRVDDIEKTAVCPLAKVMRRECKKRGLRGVRAVYSTEAPVISGAENDDPDSPRRLVPGSISFVPAAAGLAAAAEAVRLIIAKYIAEE